MNQRFVAAIIVAVAVLLSQGGGMVLAAICPHLRAQHNSCHESAPEMAMSHDNDANDEAIQSEETAASCTHCAVHSRTKQDDSALQTINSSQRASDPIVSMALSVDGPQSFVKTVEWSANAHGPPRSSGSLHLLLNVFRI